MIYKKKSKDDVVLNDWCPSTEAGQLQAHGECSHGAPPTFSRGFGESFPD